MTFKSSQALLPIKITRHQGLYCPSMKGSIDHVAVNENATEMCFNYDSNSLLSFSSLILNMVTQSH